MRNEIDISQYVSCFHDGSLFNISKMKNEITFEMSSAEVDFSEIEKGLALSKDPLYWTKNKFMHRKCLVLSL